MHSALIVLLTIGFLIALVASFVYIFIDIRISDFLWIMLFVGLELNAHGVHTAISIVIGIAAGGIAYYVFKRFLVGFFIVTGIICTLAFISVMQISYILHMDNIWRIVSLVVVVGLCFLIHFGKRDELKPITSPSIRGYKTPEELYKEDVEKLKEFYRKNPDALKK